MVLLQQGKGADIAGAFGGGASQTAFGARGATTFLHKLTTCAFVGFVLISMLLSIMEARPRASVIDKALPAAAAQQKPAAPGSGGARARRRRARSRTARSERRAAFLGQPGEASVESVSAPVPSWWNW